MTLRDEVIALLREKLGAEYETAQLAVLMKTFTLQTLAPELKARRVAALNLSSFETARKAAEDTARLQDAARQAAIDAAQASIDSEIGTL